MAAAQAWNAMLPYHETNPCNRMSRPRGQRVTVRDLAAETGVSIATVSRVLNNQANVAPDTRELVQRAVERLSGQAPGPRTAPARVTHGRRLPALPLSAD